jgi:hypothetical protein
MMPRDKKKILSNGLVMYQEVQPKLDLQPGEYILWEEQVGDFHLHLISLNFQSTLV